MTNEKAGLKKLCLKLDSDFENSKSLKEAKNSKSTFEENHVEEVTQI